MVESHSNPINEVRIPFSLHHSSTIACGIVIFAAINDFLP